ncbi:VCBS repeat-containing protein, partial [Herbaspirillum sp.]|uniref:FG-GAP repeat domain-containing protein n=1 Tax=Herbaspirillum sp. TaxID=1890675 RepID=UPI002588A53E
DNGDGRVDGDDVPEIVFVSFRKGSDGPPTVLRAISGDDGAVVFETAQFAAAGIGTLRFCDPTAGDFDGDGLPEIVTCGRVDGTNVNRLAAFEHDGTVKWLSEPYRTHPTSGFHSDRDQPLIADLDLDGVPEVIVGAHVFNGDGSLRWRGSSGQAFQIYNNDFHLQGGGGSSIAVDLDLDGFLEVVTGKTAYRHDGSIYWDLATTDGFPAVGNFDGDLEPEVVVVSRGQVWLRQHDGSLIWGPRTLPGSGPEAGGTPAVADFDGDGMPEIGIAGSNRYVVYETDGAQKWTANTFDQSSSQTGSTVFDLDGDGRFEILYRDELWFRILRGTDGQVLFSFPLSSNTHVESPVVADVDRDGN